MAEAPKKLDIGVLKFLPESLRFLAEPALRYTFEQLDELSESDRHELEEIARKVRDGNHYDSVETFLGQYSMTEFDECMKLYTFFGLLNRLELTYKNYLLSFVTDDSGCMVSMHLDLNGVDYFLESLKDIRELLIANDCPHTHLFANDELTSTKLTNQKNESNIVEHVKIYGWNDEWAKKHNLRPF